jgi:hypothetical protein
MAGGTYIRIEGIEELLAGLTRLEQMQRVKDEVQAGGILLQSKLQNYPKKANVGNPLIRSDDRVRRGFFWHLKHGDISVPYNRSYTLQSKWTSQPRKGGWEAVVGNNAPEYKHLVQGSRQTFQHRTSGWLTVVGAVDTYGPQIQARIRSALEKEVANVG